MKKIGFAALLLAVVLMIASCGGAKTAENENLSGNSATASISEENEPVKDSDGSDGQGTPDKTPSDDTESSGLSDITPTTPEDSISSVLDTPGNTPEETTPVTTPETTPPTTPETEEPTETLPTYTEPTPAKYTPRAMMYHLIRDDVYGIYDALFVRPSEFESHLILLNELGYEYIFADEWRLTDKPSVILTLDDGYLDNYTNMFPLLKKYGAKATVFIVTNLIGTEGYMTREMIAEMAASGLVSFQCHTVNHVDLRYVSEDGLHEEFSKSIEVIEGITGRPVKALAYPGGGYNSDVISVASEYFDFAYTTKSPYSVKEYTDYNVPRYYVARGDGRNQFYNNLR